MDADRKILARLVRHVQAAPQDPFTPLVDEYLIKRLRRRSRRAKGYIDMRPRHRPGKRLTPSTIGGCERAAALQFAGIRGAKKIDPRTEMIFENGDWVHRKWQWIFRDMQKVLGKKRVKVLGIEEKVIDRKRYILGYLDIAVRIKIDGEWRTIVIDVKSINERGWAQLEATHTPLEPHVRQVTTYGHMRGQVDYLCILYENKNTNEFMFLMFDFDAKVWQEVKEWCERVLSALEDERLPPKHEGCAHGNFNYEKCPHRELCYGNSPKPVVRAMMYQDFPGIDAAWEEGLAEEEASEVLVQVG